jgi:HEAT repeat protein
MDPQPSLEAELEKLGSPDPLRRNEAVEALAAIGRRAVPGVRRLAASPDAGVRAAALDTLGRIGDPGAAATLQDGLADGDEQVRAQAARGLAAIGHPAALDALLRTLDDDSDPMHVDHTPAVLALGGMGLDAVEPLLERMERGGDLTRLHAQRALQAIVGRRHGFAPETGRADAPARERAGDLWAENGGYLYDAPQAERRASVAKWRAWLARQEG